MMLSICIPTYNVNLKEIVESLSHQIKQDDLCAELIVIDDFSDESFRIENRKNCHAIQYIELPENIGRSKIRNRFLEYVKGDFLLFLDCDSAIIKDDFLKTYCAVLQNNAPEVIVGGSIYQKHKPPRNEYLRWKVSVNKESKSLKEREKANFNSFKTNNFVVSKDVFTKTPFNETITGYGHEDTLFGFELHQQNRSVYHCDNPVLNKHLDTNKAFLQKTQIGVQNLILVASIVNHDPDFIKNIQLLKVYHSLKNRKLIGIIGFGLSLFEPFLKYLLTKGYFTLSMFDLYKLRLLIKSMK